jgi:hypothetical protein
MLVSIRNWKPFPNKLHQYKFCFVCFKCFLVMTFANTHLFPFFYIFFYILQFPGTLQVSNVVKLFMIIRITYWIKYIIHKSPFCSIKIGKKRKRHEFACYVYLNIALRICITNPILIQTPTMLCLFCTDVLMNYHYKKFNLRPSVSWQNNSML